MSQRSGADGPRSGAVSRGGKAIGLGDFFFRHFQTWNGASMTTLSTTARLALLTLVAALAPLAAWGLGSVLPGGAWAAPTVVCLAALALGGALTAATAATFNRAARDAAKLNDAVTGERYPAALALALPSDAARALAPLDTVYATMKQRLGLTSAVLGGITTPFVVVDTEETLIRTNPALIKILEQTGKPEDHYGQNVALFFYGDASRPTVLRACLKEGISTNKEVELVGRRGGKRDIHIFAFPLYDLDRKLIGAMCIYLDKSEVRAREREINAHNVTVAKAVRESEDVASDVARVAGDLSVQLRKSTERAGDQSRGAEDVAAAMEQMNQAVFDVAKSASDAAVQSGEARSKALAGQEVVQQAVAAIDTVTGLTRTLRASLDDLGSRANAIGSVMAVINDIADQTNLLALNAAIEAARAGDAGRGFAVVADEVRKLAEKTMTATKEVGDAVTGIQSGTQENIRSMDEAARAVEKARELSESSGSALAEIVNLVVASSDLVQAIATAAEEQSSASSHISGSVEDARTLAREMAEALGEADAGIGSLSESAERLRTIICSINPDACTPEESKR
jgi:methyl-accepting chemotaxis protein